MKNHRLIDAETKGLVAIMEELSEVNRRIALTFNEAHGETVEMEDSPDYIEVQRHVLDAIRATGSILGRSLAEKYF